MMNNNEYMSLNVIHDDFLVDEDLSFVEADAAASSRAIDKVLGMLQQAQEVVSTDDFDLDLEPTPIGPQALFVPLQVPSTSCSIPFQNSDVFGGFPNCVPKFASSFMPVPTMPSGQNLAQSQTRQKSFLEQSTAKTSFPAKKFRKLQTGQWNERFRELLQFKEEHGHLLVPHYYPPNQQLAQWVKRQRYQYKLKHQMGKHSTLSDEREKLLSSVGFVYDSHGANWRQNFQALQVFAMLHGHCNVPTNYHEASLSVWCKHQRRQYKRLLRGESSTMNEERLRCLNSIGFAWNPRNLKH